MGVRRTKPCGARGSCHPRAAAACDRVSGLARRAADRKAFLSVPWAAALGMILSAWTSPALAQTGELAAFRGQKLAERHCGGCHAVRSGPSPVADAPPFANLNRRYFEGGLDEILSQGMLAPVPKPWPQPLRTHPRMPMARLDENEVADLKAYLDSLDPRHGQARDCRVNIGEHGACPTDDQH